LAFSTIPASAAQLSERDPEQPLPPYGWLNSQLAVSLRQAVVSLRSLTAAHNLSRDLAALLAARPDVKQKAPELSNLLSYLREFFL
jgi:hypothetical protein